MSAHALYYLSLVALLYLLALIGAFALACPCLDALYDAFLKFALWVVPARPRCIWLAVALTQILELREIGESQKCNALPSIAKVGSLLGATSNTWPLE